MRAQDTLRLGLSGMFFPYFLKNYTNEYLRYYVYEWRWQEVAGATGKGDEGLG